VGGIWHADRVEADSTPPHPLRALREARGLSQERFAQLIARDVSTVKRWEKGRTSPSAATQRRVAEALDADVAELGFADQPRREGDDVLRLLTRVQRSSVGEATIEELEQSVDRLARAYATAEPVHLLPAVVQRLQFVAGLLEGTTTLDQHRRLVLVWGWSSLLLATLCFDQGRREAAHAARAAAQRAAHESGHVDLGAWSMEAAAWFALAEGRHHEAVAAARAGRAASGPGSAALAATAAQEGRALARLCDAAGSAAAFAVAAAAADDRPAGGSFTMDGTTVAFYATTAHVWLGDPERAEEQATRVLRENGDPASANHWPTRVATVQVERALARVQHGDLDEAARLGSDAIAGAFVRRSTLWRARELDLALRDGPGPAREFHERFAQRTAVAAGGA
jgi:transcriptional regulator with XRE-family HTH domain